MDKQQSQHAFLQRELVFLYYNLHRKTRQEDVLNLATRIDNVLSLLKQNLQQSLTEWKPYLTMYYILMAQTRMEKGERELTYMSILVWYKHFPTLAIRFIHELVDPQGAASLTPDPQGIGCWADMPYLCEYVSKISNNHHIIDVCITLLNRQLSKDKNTGSPISNVAKWIPREHKRFHWLYTRLVADWFCIPINDVNMSTYRKRYRKIVSRLSSQLNLTQTKQCSQQYNEIEPETVTKTTLSRQPCLFYHTTQAQAQAQANREPCHNKCIEYSKQKKRTNRNKSPSNTLFNGIYEKTKTNIAQIIKEAFALLNTQPQDQDENYQTRKTIINNRWNRIQKPFKNNNPSSQKCIIPLLDVSYSIQTHDAIPYYTAVGLALLISHISPTGKRILTIDNIPCWVNLENTHTLMEQIECIEFCSKSYSSTTADIGKSMDIIAYSMQHTDEQHIQLVVLSNFECCIANPLYSYDNEEMYYYTQIENRFTPLRISNAQSASPCSFITAPEGGVLNVQKCNKKYTEHDIQTQNVPQIVFWNVANRGVINLPAPFYKTNTQVLSGYAIETIKHLNKFSNSVDAYEGVIDILLCAKYKRFNQCIEETVL